VIPPVYAKDAHIKSFLATPWEEARAGLTEADAILFYGYSLPQLDINAERMFERALARNGKATVTLVNPSAEAAARFAGIIRDQPLLRFRSAEEFLHRGQFVLGKRA
jgi:hypothetical protein